MLHSASSLTEHSVQLASFGSWQTGHIMLVHSLNRLPKHTGEKTKLTRLDLELRDTQPSVHSLCVLTVGIQWIKTRYSSCVKVTVAAECHLLSSYLWEIEDLL